MKENRLENLLLEFLTRLEKIEDFVIDEAPEFVKDVVKVKYIQVENNLIFTAFYASLSCAYLCFYLYFYNILKGYDVVAIMSGCIGLFSIVVLFLCILGFVYSLLIYRQMRASKKLVAIKGISDVLKGRFYE